MTEIEDAEWVRPQPSWPALRSDVGLAILLALAATLTSLLYTRMAFYDNPAPIWLTMLLNAAKSTWT